MSERALGHANSLAHTLLRELAHFGNGRPAAEPHPIAMLVRVRALAEELSAGLDDAAHEGRHRDLSYVRALMQNLFETLALADRHTSAALSLDLARATGIAGGMAGSLSHILASELGKLPELDYVRPAAPQVAPDLLAHDDIPDAAAASVSPLARRVTATAVRILPAAHQLRYREEFEAELWSLREASRLSQWRHALHILIAAWPLRRSLGPADPAPVSE